MKKFIQIVTLTLFQPFIFGQSIVVNPSSAPESALDAEPLTVEVLIDGGACSSISNFELYDNSSALFPSPDRSWGYFEKGDSDFPFESGIILTTGYAKEAEGPDSGTTSEGGSNWGGDPDLEYLINLTTEYHVDANNATIFEFDFVPYGNEISFNYIFASEEYPTYACGNFNDAFAFIISGPGITPDPGLSGKNIALLPNGDYVTINNVNADICGDDEFFVEGAYGNPFDDIEYGGRTVPLTAYSEVESGETYHIKLMIADASDYSWDSAVFLEAGSFSLGGTLVDLEGVELGEDQTICDLEEYTMVVNLDAPDATYQWFLGTDPIPGATGSQYTATESGHYTVHIDAGGCSTDVGIELTFSTSPEAVDITDFQCTPEGTYIYNLHDFEDDISTTPDVTYEFYNTLEGAEGETVADQITNPDNFEVSDLVVIYVRVENEAGCYKIIELSLEAGLGPQTQPVEYPICDDNGDGFAEFNLTDYDEEMVTSNPAGLSYEYYLDEDGTQLIPNPTTYTNISNPQIVYVKIFNPSAGEEACISYEELTLVVNEFPEIQEDQITICDNLSDNSEFIDLTQNNIVVTNGIAATLQYFPSLSDLENGTNEILNPQNFEVTTTPFEVYVNVRADNSDCTDYKVYTIIMNESPDAQNTILENCSIDDFSTYYLPDANEFVVDDASGLTFSYHISYNNALNNTGALPDDYDNTTADQVVYVRVENTNGCFDIAEVELTTSMAHADLTDVLSVCDDPYLINDQTAIFDLTEMGGTIENALGGSGYTFEYYLTLEEAQQGINPIQNPTEYQNTSSPQTIYARAFGNDTGCAGTANFQLEVLSVPEFEMDEQTAFCDIEADKFYEFTEDFASYIWYDPDGNVISNSNSVTFVQEGIHTLEVTEIGLTCPARRDIDVVFDEGPNVTEIDVNGHTVTIYASGAAGPYEYSYNNGLSWHDSNILNNVPGGIHYLIARSKYGCISDPIIFGVLGIPNVITPNGDGYNDYMTIRGLDAYPDAQIKIFDRYGKIFVDRKMGTNFNWDGRYLGNPIPSGDYWYIITIDEGKSVSGHISVRNQ